MASIYGALYIGALYIGSLYIGRRERYSEGRRAGLRRSERPPLKRNPRRSLKESLGGTAGSTCPSPFSLRSSFKKAGDPQKSLLCESVAAGQLAGCSNLKNICAPGANVVFDLCLIFHSYASI